METRPLSRSSKRRDRTLYSRRNSGRNIKGFRGSFFISIIVGLISGSSWHCTSWQWRIDSCWVNPWDTGRDRCLCPTRFVTNENVASFRIRRIEPFERTLFAVAWEILDSYLRLVRRGEKNLGSLNESCSDHFRCWMTRKWLLRFNKEELCSLRWRLFMKELVSRMNFDWLKFPWRLIRLNFEKEDFYRESKKI